jgi:hypothetical protein
MTVGLERQEDNTVDRWERDEVGSTFPTAETFFGVLTAENIKALVLAEEGTL